MRVPAERVLHYYRKRRVRQKRGVTDLAPVLQDMRDLMRAKDANLWRMIMEACIGVLVKRDVTGPGATGAAFSTILPRAAGDAGTTGSGAPTVDFTPGMVADPGPGVSLDAFVPTQQATNYATFNETTLRGIGGGSGLSYGQVSRDFTKGTYSGQRQEMLEDRKEFEPLQELAAHNLVLPVFRLFVALSALEGRIDVRGYAQDPERFCCAEYVAPPPTWIDPKAEAEAIEKLIKLRVITREEVAQMRGYRLADILDAIAAEQQEAEAKGIRFEENAISEDAPDPAIELARETAEAYEIAARTGLVTPNAEDETEFRKRLALPQMPTSVTDAWEASDGVRIPTAVAPAAPAPEPAPAKVEGEGEEKPTDDELAALAEKSDVPPNYRLAMTDAPQSCGACEYCKNGACTEFHNTAVKGNHVCDAWKQAPVPDELVPSRGSATPPPRPDGEPGIDHPDGDFMKVHETD